MSARKHVRFNVCWLHAFSQPFKHASVTFSGIYRTQSREPSLARFLLWLRCKYCMPWQTLSPKTQTLTQNHKTYTTSFNECCLSECWSCAPLSHACKSFWQGAPIQFNNGHNPATNLSIDWAVSAVRLKSEPHYWEMVICLLSVGHMRLALTI